jgi:ribosomal protein S27AE
MAKSDRMRCPKCGAEMNHHADKVVWTGEAGDVVEEMHACPKCGTGASRRA